MRVHVFSVHEEIPSLDRVRRTSIGYYNIIFRGIYRRKQSTTLFQTCHFALAYNIKSHNYIDLPLLY